jgi:hypothetical protein
MYWGIHSTEEKIEGTGIRGRRRKQLLNEIKTMRRCWKLKEKAQDRTVWRNRFGRDCGPGVDRLSDCDNDYDK